MKLPGQPGVQITVEVDGKALQEYDGEDGSTTGRPSGVKYVEAVDGVEFTINCQFQRNKLRKLLSNEEVVARVYFDGDFATSIRRQQDGQGVLDPFIFAPLRTDDSSTQGLVPQHLKNLGEIKVTCTFCRRTSKSMPAPDRQLTQIGNDCLPEKCLKGRAISNQVSLGQSQPLGYNYQTVDLTYPYGDVPFVIFVFRYRSRRDLQIEGIIPRTPSPVPLEDRDPNTLTANEIRELMDRLKAKTATNVKSENASKIKKEKRDHDDFMNDGGQGGNEDGEPVIVNETNKRARLSTDSGVEVIDLTD